MAVSCVASMASSQLAVCAKGCPIPSGSGRPDVLQYSSACSWQRASQLCIGRTATSSKQRPLFVRALGSTPEQCRGDGDGASRREVLTSLLGAAFGAVSLPAGSARAEEEGGLALTRYEDEKTKFSMLVPESWVKGEGKATGQRRVVAFYKDQDIDTNVNVVVTNLSADYTKMSSFGTADAFGEQLVNTLDRSWTKPPGQSARLIDTGSRNGMYLVEYTLQPLGKFRRHLVSAVGMGFDGTYSRLYTITAQVRDEEYPQYKKVFDQVLSSFKLSY